MDDWRVNRVGRNWHVVTESELRRILHSVVLHLGLRGCLVDYLAPCARYQVAQLIYYDMEISAITTSVILPI